MFLNIPCPNPIYLVVFKKDQPSLKSAMKLPCNQWKCPVCCVSKARKLKKKLKQDKPSNLKYFLTLTLKQNEKPLSENLRTISKCWNHLKLRIEREYGQFSYFRVTELQKNGMPHYHIAISVKPTKRFCHENWLQITKDSFQADIKQMIQVPSNYMFKYMLKIDEGKNVFSTVLPKNYHFYQSSYKLFDQITKKHEYGLMLFTKNINFILELIKNSSSDLVNISYNDYCQRKRQENKTLIEVMEEIYNVEETDFQFVPF